MPALAQRAGTQNKIDNYDFGQKTREGPAPGVRIHMSLPYIVNLISSVDSLIWFNFII